MRLLLDEMWPPTLADQLRLRDHDVSAVVEQADLSGLPDPAVFAAVQAEGRAILTENVSDYRPLAAQTLEAGESYAGLIFTTNRRYPRHDPRTVGRLVQALDTLLAAGLDVTDQEHWLP